MSNIAIKFENISKQYRLGVVGTGTISHDINRWWHLVRGKEDPYLQVGQVNDRSAKATSDYVWALKDINFGIEQGDVVGIIGKNGAGKSTLLKLLSRVTSPTTGTIKAKGRIASLLEVGTGFHPELTGRENIYMNGAIMGMTKAEITRKLDEIIDFAGVEMYIDTPTKRYSSGMTVRLGFAIAAHLEPEILVVDEVLAVGDADFQKKAIGKMQDVSRGQGRTVLFVSHNMAAVKSLTHHSILLENGSVAEIGLTTDIINTYLQSSENFESNSKYVNPSPNENKPIELLCCELEADNEHVVIKVDYVVRKKIGSVVAAKIQNAQSVIIATMIDTDNPNATFSKQPGKHTITFKFPISNLTANLFNVTLSFSDMKSERFDYRENILSFIIEESTDLLENHRRDSICKSSSNLIII